MKFKFMLFCVAIVMSILPSLAVGEIVNGVNWADEVTGYSSAIQNYGIVDPAEYMNENTEFWVTGAPDADVNGNGYGWDAGVDLDYVAGWRATNPDQYITVYFETALTDVSGDDLSIKLYGGGKVNATVYVSLDGNDFTEIGSIGGGTSGYFRTETFDFDGLFTGDAHYVKVSRNSIGNGTGMFIDAFGGTAVPEPGSVALLAVAGLAALGAFVYRKER